MSIQTALKAKSLSRVASAPGPVLPLLLLNSWGSMAMEEKVCLAGAPPRAVMNDIMHSCAARRGQRSTEPADPETIVRHRCGLDLAGSGPRACSGSGVPSRIRASCCSASPRLPHRPRRRGHQGIFALRMLLLPPLLRLFGDFDSVLWNPSPPTSPRLGPLLRCC